MHNLPFLRKIRDSNQCTQQYFCFYLSSGSTLERFQSMLVQHDISLTWKYQGPHLSVKLPPFRKRILLIFNNHGSHVIPKMGGLITQDS